MLKVIQHSFRPINLLCEYRENPIGIDRKTPRFTWIANLKGRNKFQSAYRIIVSSTTDKAKQNIGDIWDTKKVFSSQSANIIYNGKKLESEQEYFWKIKIFDGDTRESEFSDINSFEMGLREQSLWQGQWISAPVIGYEYSPMFRRVFKIDKKIKKARAYICGLGYYELYINGIKMGDHVLDPGWTDYEKRVLYETYDVTEALLEGDNAVGVILGTGWYLMPLAPQMILQLNIEYGDGSKESIVSSNKSGWKVTDQGPIVKNSIYVGEIYDARREKPLWNTINYKEDNDWIKPSVAEPPTGILRTQNLEAIKVVDEIKPINVTNPKDNIYVYDMGQNIAGWARLKVKGKEGDKVVIKFAEIIYDNGLINQENLRTDRIQDVYILKGEGDEVYEPRFTYHGFRYVQIEGCLDTPDIESIMGCVVRSSVKQIGHFSCSDELITKIQENIKWTEANNLHSLPTDCPQRDERLGWLNDATVRTEAAIYNFDMSSFYDKWENDIMDAQGNVTGAITCVAPFERFGHRPADPVCTTYIIIPWLLYTHFGDTEIIRDHYEGLKKWEDYLDNQAEEYIVEYSYYGDWAAPLITNLNDTAVSGITPGALMSTGYYYYNAILLQKMATVIEKKEDVQLYKDLAEKIKTAFNEKYFNAETCQYATGSQASNVFPLYLGIVPDEHEKRVADNIVKDVIAHDYHLTTGNLCTKYLMEMLSKYGYNDIAYKLITQTTYPSWGYMVENGATTIWERWENATGKGMNSHDHPMYGAVSTWFYKYLAGISVDEDEVSFAHIYIKPYIIEELDFIKCSLETVKGLVESNWYKTDDEFILDITIAFNSKATVYIPLNKEKQNMIIKEGNDLIWDNNTYIKSEDILFDNKDDEYISFTIGSGTYKFKRTQK